MPEQTIGERVVAENIASHEEFMRRYFPKEYAKRKAEGRCIHCGAKKPTSPLASREQREDG